MKQVYMNHSLSSNDFTHDYDIIESVENSDTVMSLVRSSNKQWVEEARGGEAVRIQDNGEGLLIESLDKFTGTKYSIVLDYGSAEELFILLSQQDFAPFEIKESKTTMKWPLSPSTTTIQ